MNSTFEELRQRVQLVSQRFNNFSGVIDVIALLREAENEYLKKTGAVSKIHTEDTSADSFTTPTVPADFYKEHKVYWDGRLIPPTGLNADINYLRYNTNNAETGYPECYRIDGTDIKLFPEPTSGGYLTMPYTAINVVEDGLSPIVPVDERLKLVNYVVAVIAELNNEMDLKAYYENEFAKGVAESKSRHDLAKSQQSIVRDATGGAIV